MRYKCARAFTNGPHFFLANDDDSSLNWTTEIFKNEKEGVITHTHTHLHAPQRPFALLDCRMLRRRPKVRVSACECVYKGGRKPKNKTELCHFVDGSGFISNSSEERQNEGGRKNCFAREVTLIAGPKSLCQIQILLFPLGGN